MVPICLRHNGTRLEHRGIGAEPHGAARVGLAGDGFALVGHRGDDRIGGAGVELRRIRPAEPDRPGRLDDDALQAQAQTQHRQTALARVADRADLALDPADAEATRDQHGMHVAEHRRCAAVGFAVVGGHPAHLNLGAVLEAAGTQRFGHRQVSIGEVNVLAHQCDPHSFRGLVHSLEQVVPLRPVDVTKRQAEPAHHVGVEFLAVQHLGDVVDRRRVRGGDHTVDVDVAHQGDLVLQRFGHVAVAAQDQRVGRDADAAQRGDRVLGGFGLQLARRRQNRAPASTCRKKQFSRPTSWRTCRAASRNGSDSMSPTVPPISVITMSGRSPSASGLGHRQDPALDLIGDVRDDLDGVAEVLAAALLRDHRRIHLPGSHIRRSGQVAVEETLVVPDVEVGFGAVLGDEYLAVLERVHGARIDVEVRVQLLHRDLQTAGGQQLAEARRGQALAERGNDAAADEEMLGGGLRMLA